MSEVVVWAVDGLVDIVGPDMLVQADDETYKLNSDQVGQRATRRGGKVLAMGLTRHFTLLRLHNCGSERMFERREHD
jgi:hypothetical protein